MTMVTERNELRDVLHTAHSMARELTDSCGMVGYGFAELRDGDGKLKLLVPFANLITDVGDAYYAAMGIALVNPAAPAQPTKLLGMGFGTGVTAVAKNGAGSAISAFLVGQAFDATFPSVSNLGAGLGVNMVYKTSLAAGVGTGTITEAVTQNTTVASAAAAAATISRTVLGTAIPKQAADTLAFTWNHKTLGV